MAITGTNISTRVGILLNDTGATRWTGDERLVWINDGRREMGVKKPEIFGNGTEVTHTLTESAKQLITTTGAYAIAGIDYNVTTGNQIRKVTRQALDFGRPTWRTETGTEVKNWTPDETDPLAFWVNPIATGDLKAHVFITPTDLNSLSDIALPFDIYEPILVNYVCYRALSKEDEAAAAAKAQAFYQLFTSALGA